MTDKKDEAGKASPRPAEGPKRPYATIDLQATEVGGKPKGGPAAAGPSPDVKPASLLPPGVKPDADSDRLAAVKAWSASMMGSNTFLSHVAAGVAGAVLTLLVGALLGLLARGEQAAPDIARRLAALEQAQKRGAAPQADVGPKLAAVEKRLAGVEDGTRAAAGLADAQAKLSADMQALAARMGPSDLGQRLNKVETAVAAMGSGDPAARGPVSAALAAKLAELERLAMDAGETAKSGTARVERELAQIKGDATRLGQRADTLRGEIEERFHAAAKTADVAPLMAKLAAVEQELRGLMKGEGERSTSAQRVLLSLEMANLKRAMDRGERYGAELEAVKKAAAGMLDLAPLQRYSLDGVPTARDLSKDFRRVANAAMDAEAEPADATVLDRLMAGARGMVRVRKAGHSAEDMGAEALIARMEAALKDGRLGEVLVQGKRLPPKAALAFEDWLGKVAARHAVDQSVADIEAALKASLAPRRGPGAEPRQ